MPAPDTVKLGKLHVVLAMVIIAAAMIAGPYGLAALGLMPQLKPHAWAVLAIAYVGILLKAPISYFTTGNFRYDKFAYDALVLVFGGVLTCISLQMVSTTDLFPGLDDISFLRFTKAFGLSAYSQHLLLLFMLLLASLAGTMFAAMGVADTESGNPSSLWTFFCCVGAGALLAAYALALIAKE